MPRRPRAVVRADYEQTLLDASENGWEPKCKDKPALYVDFKIAPPAVEAKRLCLGDGTAADRRCPMAALCKEWAHATKPEHGIYGGEVWQKGKKRLTNGPGRQPANLEIEPEEDEDDFLVA